MLPSGNATGTATGATAAATCREPAELVGKGATAAATSRREPAGSIRSTQSTCRGDDMHAHAQLSYLKMVPPSGTATGTATDGTATATSREPAELVGDGALPTATSREPAELVENGATAAATSREPAELVGNGALPAATSREPAELVENRATATAPSTRADLVGRGAELALVAELVAELALASPHRLAMSHTMVRVNATCIETTARRQHVHISNTKHVVACDGHGHWLNCSGK